MKKKIVILLTSVLFAGLIITVTMVTTNNIQAQNANSGQNTSPNIVYVVNGGQRNDNAKYFYKDLRQGLGRVYKPVINFLNYKDAFASKTLFSDYDVVILVNENSSDDLHAGLKSFALKNKNQSNMIVTAFLPRGNSRLATKQEFDVISSASREKPAKNLIMTSVSYKVLDIIMREKN